MATSCYPLRHLLAEMEHGRPGVPPLQFYKGILESLNGRVLDPPLQQIKSRPRSSGNRIPPAASRPPLTRGVFGGRDKPLNDMSGDGPMRTSAPTCIGKGDLCPILRAADSRPYGIFRSLPKRRVREAAPYAPAPATPARQSQARKWNRTSRHFCKPRAQRPDEGIGPYKICLLYTSPSPRD